MSVNAIAGTDSNTLAAQAVKNTNNIAASNTYFSNYMDQASVNSGNYLEQIFQKASDTYNVSKELLKAMAKAESGFDPNATSHCGAMGIMQLMPATASGLGVTDAYDPEQNIMGGAKYISQLLEKYKGNLSYAVAAYNAGGGSVDKYGGIPPYKETQNYVAKVLRYLEEGVTIPGSSSAAAANSAAGQVASKGGAEASNSGSGNLLQDVITKYFDYDDYLEFIQLFTKVLYEKLTGEQVDKTENKGQSADGEGAKESKPTGQSAAEPVKHLAMKYEDSFGNIRMYQQDETEKSDAYVAYQNMAAGNKNRVAVYLNQTV